jgi:glycosyltransferase involved in cell wall biosynthesis
MMRILATDNYGMKFNVARNSKHVFVWKRFVPWRKFWRPLDSIATWMPSPGGYQMIHSFNRIPYTAKPWIVTFESGLPRTLGGGDWLKRRLRKRLLHPSCKRVIAMSEYARGQFIEENRDWPRIGEALERLDVIHPSVPIRALKPKSFNPADPLRVIFVGNDFARKGGIVSLRIAQKAKRRGLNIELHIVSALNYGPPGYCDHQQRKYYQSDLKLLSLENVIYHGKQPNQAVLLKLDESHLNLLPTLDDTYGYSVLEGFAGGAPAITSDVCALPEFVKPDQYGALLKLASRPGLRWPHVVDPDRSSPAFWEALDSAYESLAEQAMGHIEALMVDPTLYQRLSAGALDWVARNHNVQITSERLDSLYLGLP